MKTLLSILTLLAITAAVPANAQAAPKPNFLVILSDDVGWGDFQCYNPQGKIPTPNIDRLAREGMRFTDAHTPAALCAPTRYTMVTGNYPWRGAKPNGTWGFSDTPQFLPGQKTIGHILQTAGYRTAMFGKTHFGGVFEKTADGRPDFTKPMKVGHREWGFDYSYVLLGGHQAPPYMFFENNQVAGDATKVTQLKQGPLHNGQVPRDGPGLPDWDSSQVGAALLGKAVAFIDDCLAKEKADGKPHPFYIHFCSDGAHGPYTPPDTLLGAPVKGVSKMTAHTDMVHEVDVLVGKFVEALTQRGLLASTLIAVTSDNGGLPFERDYGHDAVGGLHGQKSYIWEGGHRVPFVVRWGDGTPQGSKIAPGTVRNQVVGVHDIVPTMAELAAATAGPDQMLDSVSLAPVLLGQRGDDQPVRQTLLVQSSPGRDALTEAPSAVTGGGGAARKGKKAKTKGQGMTQQEREQAFSRAAHQAAGSSDGMAHALREGPWKLVLDMQDKPAALYNLADDLAELRNLLNDPAQAARVKRMEQLYRDIRKSKRST